MSQTMSKWWFLLLLNLSVFAHPNVVKIAYGIEGRSLQLIQWIKMLNKMEMKAQVTLFLLTYDEPMEPLHCNDLTVICIHRPNTTWTSGRNQLVQKIAQHEHIIKHHFKYWLFVDQDLVKLAAPCANQVESCRVSPERQLYSLEIAACCYDFTTSMLIAPEVQYAAVNFVSYSGIGAKNSPTFIHQDCADGAMNAFHRQVIPVVFPMIDLIDDNTWWESQAIHWHLIKGCFPGYSVISNIFNVFVYTEHSEYPGGRCPEEAATAIRSVYGKYGLVPEVISLNKTRYDMGCEGTIPGTQGLDYLYEKPVADWSKLKTTWPSDAWQNSTLFARCFHALKPRFLKFMETGDLVPIDGKVYPKNNCTGKDGILRNTRKSRVLVEHLN